MHKAESNFKTRKSEGKAFKINGRNDAYALNMLNHMADKTHTDDRLPGFIFFDIPVPFERMATPHL